MFTVIIVIIGLIENYITNLFIALPKIITIEVSDFVELYIQLSKYYTKHNIREQILNIFLQLLLF